MPAAPRVEFDGQVKVERAAARCLRVQIDLPGLSHGVGLDEVTLIVNVKAVLDGLVFQAGDVPGEVDDGHRGSFQAE